MPAAVASRARDSGRNPTASRDTLPPAKKTKLSQSAPAPRQNGYSALLNGAPNKKPTVASRTNGVKNSRKQKVDEAAAVVGAGLAADGDVDMEDAGKEVIEISSAEEASEYSSSDEEEEEHAAGGAQEPTAAEDAAPATNGHADAEEGRPVENGTAEPEELSFGERLQAHEPEAAREPDVVDIEEAFAGQDDDSRALATASKNRPLSIPSATSLGTVLTQALRTNDKDLLDSCFRVNDMNTIYATVERLPSPLVGNLLQKLAERLYKKPGKAGMLMVWVQWSLAAHGGYLATQPQLVKQLATLNKVLKERASGLQPLLSLKGRLDMLQAQLELRKRNQRRAAADDEDEAVIYVEGEDDVSSADEDDASMADRDAILGSPRKRTRQDSDEDESSVDEMPTTMEVDEGEEGSEDSEDLLDDEAEETENDTGDDMSEPMSDDDLDDVEGEDVSGSEEESKPARRSTVGRAGLSRRY